MWKRSKSTGFALVLAWPETSCKQTGSWYDGLMEGLGFSKDHYYKVGHAAVVLIQAQNGSCSYFDFGRYHAPFGYGRVRDKESDPDLAIRTRARISADGKLENAEEILKELLANESCHGIGSLYASCCEVNFTRAFLEAKSMQEQGFWKYGPFVWKGTNCSRFVRTVALAGVTSLRQWVRLYFPLSITPMPMGNVGRSNRIVLKPEAQNPEQHGCTGLPVEKIHLTSTLPEPIKPEHLSPKAKWLAGEGAGSWFFMETEPFGFRVSRYSPDGILEYQRVFQNSSNSAFDPHGSWEISYPSSAFGVTLFQKGSLISLGSV